MAQLKKLQTMITSSTRKSAQTGTCIAVSDKYRYLCSPVAVISQMSLVKNLYCFLNVIVLAIVLLLIFVMQAPFFL